MNLKQYVGNLITKIFIEMAQGHISLSLVRMVESYSTMNKSTTTSSTFRIKFMNTPNYMTQTRLQNWYRPRFRIYFKCYWVELFFGILMIKLESFSTWNFYDLCNLLKLKFIFTCLTKSIILHGVN
jgi:hypothetical protein